MPGTTPERIAKAVTSAADGLILDLEDTVAPAQKGRAREWVVAALRRVDFRGRERVVRVNALDTAEGRDDLAAVVPARPDALLVPKLGAPEGLLRMDEAVACLEAGAGLESGSIRFHLLIETVAAVMNVEALAWGSSRNVVLLFGDADLLRETRGRLVASRASELYALSRVLFAARAAGLDAIDTPHLDLGDHAGLEAHARVAVDLGYDGKAVIHPNQIEAVNRAFTPSAGAIDEAQRVLAAYESSESAGAGALTVDGRLVDLVHVRMARAVLDRARRAGAFP